MKPYRKLAPLAAAAGLLATSGHAATLLQGEFQEVGDVNGAKNSTSPGISVTSSSEGYSTGNNGLGTGGLDGSFNNPIVDYAFYTSGSGLTQSLGGAATLINASTAGSTNTDVENFDIWAGSSTAGTADQLTYARAYNITGTVDIIGSGIG